MWGHKQQSTVHTVTMTSLVLAAFNDGRQHSIQVLLLCCGLVLWPGNICASSPQWDVQVFFFYNSISPISAIKGQGVMGSHRKLADRGTAGLSVPACTRCPSWGENSALWNSFLPVRKTQCSPHQHHRVTIPDQPTGASILVPSCSSLRNPTEHPVHPAFAQFHERAGKWESQTHVAFGEKTCPIPGVLAVGCNFLYLSPTEEFPRYNSPSHFLLRSASSDFHLSFLFPKIIKVDFFFVFLGMVESQKTRQDS